ncbi:MAG: electron transport complex subunit E, partial [Bacilli bacterium]|nr:electron transport complex subunit E [Bacilli bacterium]
MKKENELFKIFSAGIFKENPIFVLFLGMCPTLGVTTSVINGIGMGIGVIFVLLLSNIIISLIRNIVMDEIRIPVFIVIIASLVTLLQMFMQAYTLDLYNSMKVFIPLITVNCIILGRAEAFASKNGVGKSIIDALGMGIGFMLSLVIVSFFRELLGTGAIMGIQIFPAEFAIPIFTSAVGAFLTLGFLAGIAMLISNKRKDKE